MMVGYGEPYTGTQLETPETAKRDPKVRIQGYAEAAEVMEGRGLAKGNLGGCNRDRTQCRDTLQQALTGYDRRRTGCQHPYPAQRPCVT